MYGRISNYISSVAAPFHPFGGAVDIIVVQQQDGTFKGTPWYVRFGKFQGVLKLNEKIVTVSVNGVDADFHMHLLNNGQAYFLREEDSDEEDRSSHSSVEDDVVIGSRRESFKSARSLVDIEEQVDSGVGGYGDDEMKENKIKASLDVDGISRNRQNNGEVFISFPGHCSNLSDEQFENDNSNSLPVDENNAREPNLEITLDNRVNLALLPSEDASLQQEASAISLQGEFANGNEIQNVSSRLEPSTVQHIKSTFVKIDTVSQTEYQGRDSDIGWNSYKDTSVFIMEESSSTHGLAGGNTSQTDDIVLSRYSTYDYENMELSQSEDVLDFGKAEDSSSEVVLMSVDGHVMTAPISSFKRVGSTNLIRDISANKINPLETLDNNSTENRADHCDLENKQGTNSGNNWQKVAATGTGESIMQTQYGFGISESVLGSERECKQIEQLTDSANITEIEAHTENHSRESDECCVQSKVDTLQMPRTESEIEFAFNDEEIFKSCLALNELSTATGEEEKKYSLTSPLETDEGCNMGGSDGSETEPSSAALQLDNPQALLAESSHLSKISSKSDFQHLVGSMPDISMHRSRPIHIPGQHAKVGGNAQASGSLPNLRVPSASMERAVTERVYRHSLDINSSFCKWTPNNDIYTPRFENAKHDLLKKEKDQTAGASESFSLDDKDTLNKSVQPDMDVKISLCRDLLFKGMGAEAAAEAFDSKRVSREVFRSSGAEIIKNEKLVVKISNRYYPWSAAAPIILGMVALGLEAPAEVEGEISVDHVETKAVNDYASNTIPSSSGRWRLWPFTFRRLKTPEKSTSGRSDSQVESVVDQEISSQSSCDKEVELKSGSSKPPQKRKVQTNIPTSEQLASLNLKEGQNMITFTFLTTIWGKQQVDARIYLWKWNTRIVISDVDGTITKSDVLGQVMPLVGKDWTQTGVARLFSAIKENGYQLLFLSARAIAQAYLTRQFLLNLKQDGKALPDGPVVISPDGLFPSLYREVIRRAPHEFKIACLEDIRLLFPPDCNPFYAGFGNRDTDEISYLKVGIPKGKIFIINPKGEVVVNHSVAVKSYTSLHKLADDMFPPMSTCEQEAFNSWNYWKVPLPDIEI
ncbi:phosphatidate phosphatase PAH1 isoform X2 [Cryptomeria japonica]|uniref:phosphatidate phosphatase PAH1 isoform X2 n=1 Tax=Cryptomeria japonica TaxID=3369 RepID=UPI0027DA1E85|nr:phosphatidate phosphatase PAH1 isoform X2 [Cryptomeria japonica]